MSKIVKRGYMPGDEKEFGDEALTVLHEAGRDIYYLLNRGYPIKSASTFVGNHFLLSERQRLALVRAVSPEESLAIRNTKEIRKLPQGSLVHIDGFNTIITLEVALSGSLLLNCMDGTIRDLAALRGTYRLIDKTDTAILLIGKKLKECGVGKAVFYLDAPVSNSGRLGSRIRELLRDFDFQVETKNIHNVDAVLKTLDAVVTSDAIILDMCKSWVNLNRQIIDEQIKGCQVVDFSFPGWAGEEC